MKKKIIITTSIILGIVILGLSAWTLKTYKASDLAYESLISDNKVQIVNDEFISFTPQNIKVNKGFIVYPGGGVEPEAYAPICREIASHGYEVIIAKMPLNLAILSPNKADKIIKNYDYIDTWAIGGHRLEE